MSLVNDMLRDLDQRKVSAGAAGVTAEVMPADGPASAGQRWTRRAIWLGALLIVVGLLISVYHSLALLTQRHVPQVDVSLASSGLSPVTTDAVARIEPQVPVAEEPVAPVSPVAIKPAVQVKRVVYSKTERGANLVFHLSTPLSHQLQQLAEDRLQMLLPNTRLQQPLPDLSELHLLRAVDVSRREQDLQLSLYFAEAVEVQSYLVGEQSAKLHIEIIRSAVSLTQSGVPTVAPESVRQPAEQQAVVAVKSGSVESAGVAKGQAVSTKTAAKKPAGIQLKKKDQQVNRRALKLIGAGEHVQAQQLLLAFVQENKSSLYALETLVKLYLAQQNVSAAEQWIDQGLARHPNQSALVKLKARSLMLAESFVAAIALLEQHLLNHGTDLEYQSLLASCYQRDRQFAKATLLYQRLVTTAPRQSRFWIGLALALEGDGRTRDAVAAYQAAKKLPDISAQMKTFASQKINALN